jgi:hypothetical protein
LHLGIISTGWSSLSRVARGTTRGPFFGTCFSGFTSVPSSLKLAAMDYRTVMMLADDIKDLNKYLHAIKQKLSIRLLTI